MYFIRKITGNPAWENIPVIHIDHVLWTEDAGIRAQGQLCCDDENLYVHMQAIEKNIRAEYRQPLSPVFQDSCLEFFFQPEGGDRYFNFEVNPNGCMCIQIGPDRNDRINLVRNDAAEYFGVYAGRTSDGWEVFYRIPLEFIRFFYPGYVFDGDLEANMYKCGDKTDKIHFLAWCSVETPTPDFHRPKYFGKMHFDPLK